MFFEARDKISLRRQDRDQQVSSGRLPGGTMVDRNYFIVILYNRNTGNHLAHCHTLLRHRALGISIRTSGMIGNCLGWSGWQYSDLKTISAMRDFEGMTNGLASSVEPNVYPEDVWRERSVGWG